MAGTSDGTPDGSTNAGGGRAGASAAPVAGGSGAPDAAALELPGALDLDLDLEPGGGGRFPWALACRAPGATLEGTCAWLRAEREALVERAERHGAVLFRGFPVTSAEDFDAFVRALGLENFPYRESLSNAVRTNLTPRVFTANEAPAPVTIALHHEMAQTPLFPRHLVFFCERPADAGGATALCRSDALYEALRRELPDFARACAEKGLIYRHVMPPENDPGSGLGRSWRSTLGVERPDEAEARLRELGYRFEWLQGECLRAITPVLPAVKELPGGRTSFFNQLLAAFAWRDARNTDASAVTHGDGSPVDAEAAARTGELAERFTVDLAWERGDVALVDNFVTMHGRRTFEGRRRVLASLAAG